MPTDADPAQEKSILEPFLKMMELEYESFSVDNRKAGEALKNDFLDKLLFGGRRDSPYRYIHIAAHGDGNSLFIGPKKDCHVDSKDVRSHRCDDSKHPLDGSLITVSACGSLLGGLAAALCDRGAISVIRPLSDVELSRVGNVYHIVLLHVGLAT